MYTDRKTTPLAYHNFIKYFSLPVSILACIAMLIFGIVNESWIGIAFSIPMLAAHIASFVGFLKWRYYGIMCFLAGAVLSLVFELVAVTDGGGNVLGLLVAGAIYLGTLVIYYSKREKLFVKRSDIYNSESSTCDELKEDQQETDHPESSRRVCVSAPQCSDTGDPFADMIEKYGRTQGTPAHRTNEDKRGILQGLFVRYWRFGVVAAIALIVGVMAGFLIFQSRIISLHDKVDELSEKYSSAQTSDRIKLHDEYVRGYEAGHEDGYNDGYVACDDEKEDQYEIGYDFAIESAVSSMRIYRESLQAAIYYNDRQTLNHLMTLDFRGYFMGW